jgi:putative SOS response-associated peptidase YedK
MCYSAQVIAEYRLYVRLYGADISFEEFVGLYWMRTQDRSIKIPKAIDAWFESPENEQAKEIAGHIAEFKKQEGLRLGGDLFKQRKRLADAERRLQAKPDLKGAADDKRIATNKVEQILGWLSDMRRTELTDQDRRIYPGWYVPVMVMENGRRVIKPMRYQCRPAGKPAFYDRKFPGTYNARRDNLEGFWKDLFGYSHGVMLADAFFENVPKHKAEHRELQPGEEAENLILEFRPNTRQPMLVACLWSRWSEPGMPHLLSCAAITDEPPPEVAAAGHDRCIVPIKAENLDAWLTPEKGKLADQYAILDDRERPYYEHRLAA